VTTYAPIRLAVPLAELTTLRLGGPAQRLVRAESTEAVVDAVRAADADGEPLLVLGGGSNLVVADAGVPGTWEELKVRAILDLLQERDSRPSPGEPSAGGSRENAGIAVSAQIPVAKWWMAILYSNVNYSKFSGVLYGENLHVDATTLLLNVNNQFTLPGGGGGELSGFYRTKGVEGQGACEVIEMSKDSAVKAEHSNPDARVLP